jgi:hypothetical protein
VHPGCQVVDDVPEQLLGVHDNESDLELRDFIRDGMRGQLDALLHAVSEIGRVTVVAAAPVVAAGDVLS